MRGITEWSSWRPHGGSVWMQQDCEEMKPYFYYVPLQRAPDNALPAPGSMLDCLVH